ncbi:CACTA en-spm transposon protein [Cucumis melo var. makuwa]|uniref:CACTA en-spm transposon protein n=1 Tax=Cucumis melo var. makuwa TaxID=1194695 RepID=A0A5A7VAS6_CUCMM|nr:CACTA en-spm transposon protein [Cucumis melo var. makuwa]
MGGSSSVDDTSGVDKAISLHDVRFRNTIDVLTRDTFPVCRINTWKEFKGRTIGISSSPTSRRNTCQPTKQIGESCGRLTLPLRSLLDSTIFQEQSRTIKVARVKQPYNHSSGSKSFLQR